MVRRGPYNRQTSRVINAGMECDVFERYQALVMIHGQYGIKFPVRITGEKAVSRIRAETEDTFFFCLLKSRDDDVLLFRPDQSVVACMRIQTQYGNFGFLYPKVLLKGGMHDTEL